MLIILIGFVELIKSTSRSPFCILTKYDGGCHVATVIGRFHLLAPAIGGSKRTSAPIRELRQNTNTWRRRQRRRIPHQNVRLTQANSS